MRARTVRRMAERSEANRNTAKVPPADWAAMNRQQRRNARQAAVCPTCLRAVPGLLAGCDLAGCRTADHDYDAAMDARCDR